MDSLKRRLKYYGFGFLLGLVFVVLFFNNRGCSWLPSNRVKNAIMDRLIVISDENRDALKEKGLTDKDIIEILNDGDVNFGESDKEAESKVYILEKGGVRYAFTLPQESFISEVFVNVKNAHVKQTKQGYGDILHFPADENLVYPDSTDLVSCQLLKLGIIKPKKILEYLKRSGKIDFGKSNFEERPKPVHHLIFTKDEKEIGAKVIWYKNKLNITSFVSDGMEECLE